MSHLEKDKDQISENLRRIAAEMADLQKKLDALRRQIATLQTQAGQPLSATQSGGLKDGATDIQG